MYWIQACQVEMDPSLVSSYIIFLSKHALVEFLDDLALVILYLQSLIFSNMRSNLNALIMICYHTMFLWGGVQNWFVFVQDISQLIVERTSVMNHILPDSSTEPGSEQYQTLEAFLQLYHYYTMKVRRLEKVEYSWVSRDHVTCPHCFFKACESLTPTAWEHVKWRRLDILKYSL